ncbi:MAG: ATP-grasp domain-containing protein [Lachnospiraceae bacterium]|nr:ATP-grasp domain-containing protein [Lachnospiraceae bacterium]
MVNILILAAGTRNKVVQYFKRTFEGFGNVIATDASKLGPAIYEADRFYIVPPITAEGYIDVILDICRKEQISGVLSLIDPELSLLAKNAERFRELGVTVIGSSYELCEMSLDKMQMYHWLLEHGYRCARSWKEKEAFYEAVDRGEITYPVFVKPYRGSASISISKVYDRETVDLLFEHSQDLMIQEFLNGQEIGADVYIDLISGEVVSIFTKKKILMRAGETDKAVSFKDPELFALIEKFVKEAGFRGQIDIDIFKIDGQYYISEVNPRFGGGYPHAYESGCDHMKLVLENLRGNANVRNIGAYDEGVYMMKYNEVKIIRDEV